MTKRHIALAFTVSWILSSVGNAAFTLNWVPVLITVTTDAMTPAPGLAGYQCWDLILDADVGDDFQSYRMWSPPGQNFSYFSHSLASTAPWAPPSLASITAFPTLQYTLQQSGPAGAALSVLGAYNGINELPPPATFGPNSISIVAGDTVSYTDGVAFRLLRLTWKGDGIPYFNGRVSVNVGGQTVNVPLPDGRCPEPATLSLLAFGLVMCSRLRMG